MADNEDKKHERRSFRWIDPHFQRKYALLLLAFVLFISAMLIGTFWYHSSDIINSLKDGGVSPQNPLLILLEGKMKSLIWSVYFIVGVFSMFTLIVANFLSHKIVGPIYAIKKSLDAIAIGDYKAARLKVRKGDEFQDVIDLMNTTVDKLEK